MRKWLYISVGIIGLGLGAVGAVMPMLPAFPFLMLAAYCFGKSSERLDQWFRNTKLYKDNLEDYVSGRGMTRKAKIRVVITVTVLMSIGFLIMFGKGISKTGDILDLAAKENIVEKSGAWYAYSGAKIGQGRENAKIYLENNPALCAEVEAKVREKYGLQGSVTPAESGEEALAAGEQTEKGKA